jgi:hypothetical protein
MAPRNLFLGLRQFAVWDASRRPGLLSIAAVAAIHLTALVSMMLTEVDLYGKALFLLVWGVVNFVLLLLLRRRWR